MQMDDEVFWVSRAYNTGVIMTNTFDSLEKAIAFKDRYSDLNEWNDDYYTLETTSLVSTVSEMIDLTDKYEKNMFELINQKDTERAQKWTAVKAFADMRDEWLNESKYVLPAITLLSFISFFEEFMIANEYTWGFVWVGVSYALYKVQKFFIYRKTRGVFDNF